MEHGKEQKPDFIMNVRKYFKTALARQVPEAVLIRRRGGKGAVSNSQGEFSRRHIPRLQVKMEEHHDNSEHREQTSKHLREQDKEWDNAGEGSSAIMGPRYSPTKRQMEPLDGAPKRREGGS